MGCSSPKVPAHILFIFLLKHSLVISGWSVFALPMILHSRLNRREENTREEALRVRVSRMIRWSGATLHTLVHGLCTHCTTCPQRLAQRNGRVRGPSLSFGNLSSCRRSTLGRGRTRRWHFEDGGRTATVGNEDGNRWMYLSAIDQGLLYPFVQFSVFYMPNVWSQTIPFGSLAKFTIPCI